MRGPRRAGGEGQDGKPRAGRPAGTCVAVYVFVCVWGVGLWGCGVLMAGLVCSVCVCPTLFRERNRGWTGLV